MANLAGEYKARVNVFRDGKYYAPGSVLQFSHEEAERCLAEGAIEKLPPSDDAKAAPTEDAALAPAEKPAQKQAQKPMPRSFA